ncbi:hypothetical protein CR513_37331, partial [Mucuna pruriens]
MGEEGSRRSVTCTILAIEQSDMFYRVCAVCERTISTPTCFCHSSNPPSKRLFRILMSVATDTEVLTVICFDRVARLLFGCSADEFFEFAKRHPFSGIYILFFVLFNATKDQVPINLWIAFGLQGSLLSSDGLLVPYGRYLNDQKRFNNVTLSNTPLNTNLEESERFTEPIAYEIFFTSIHKHLDSFLKKCGDTHFQISHPVLHHSTIHCATARNELPNQLTCKKSYKSLLTPSSSWRMSLSSEV